MAKYLIAEGAIALRNRFSQSCKCFGFSEGKDGDFSVQVRLSSEYVKVTKALSDLRFDSNIMRCVHSRLLFTRQGMHWPQGNSEPWLLR